MILYARIRSVLLFISLSLFISACDNKPVADSAVMNPEGYSDVAGIKLEVGKLAPDFTLSSMAGGEVQLSSLQGKPLLLIFYRGYWCPFCIGNLQDIQSILPELSKKGVQVIAISPDDIDDLKTMANRLDNPYWFLSDPDLEVADLYGIRRDEELPHPAVILIDTKGVVQWFYVGENYKERPSASQINAVINRLDL